MQQMIPVDQFINAVKKRPAIWDADSEDYKDRDKKKDGWLQVCRVMCSNFESKTKDERLQIARDMQLKWKNLRDAYVRHIRLTLRKSKTSKSVRPYIYANQMAFLRRVINIKSRPDLTALPNGNYIKAEEQEEDEEGELTKEDLMELEDHDMETGIRSPSCVVDTDLPANVDPLLPQTVESDVHDNDDMNFFKSLLPSLQTLRVEQKLKFRIDVMELLMTYHQNAAD